MEVGDPVVFSSGYFGQRTGLIVDIDGPKAQVQIDGSVGKPVWVNMALLRKVALTK